MPHWIPKVVIIGTLVFTGPLVVLIATFGHRGRIIQWIQRLLTRLPERWQAKGLYIVRNFIDGLVSLRNIRRVLLFMTMTVMAWSMDVLWFYLVSQAFSISLNMPALVLVVAAASLGTMIPALPGYVGTFHFVVVSLLIFFRRAS